MLPSLISKGVYYQADQALDIIKLPLLELALVTFTLKDFVGKSQLCI